MVKHRSPLTHSYPFAGALPSAASPTGAAAAAAADGCNSLPNFLLVKITDLRSVERLQNLLVSEGVTVVSIVRYLYRNYEKLFLYHSERQTH